MIELTTGFRELRSNPQIMIKGKASPFVLPREEAPAKDGSSAAASRPRLVNPEEVRMLKDLELRDKAVRDEEEAHARMLGRHAGAIRYEYQIGPDGKAYVINGSVEVNPKFDSTSPDEIRRVLQTIQKAAVTVSNPSQADLNIAASAANKISMMHQRTILETYRSGIEQQGFSWDTESSTFSSNQLRAQA
jgi:hypothetical protein